MPWPFEREYMQLALAAGVVVGVCAPLIGAFLVPRRLALLGDGIGHVAFAGVAGGLLVEVWPTWTALAFAVLAALGIDHLRRRGRATGDVALAIFFYSGIAAGVVLVGLANSMDASLFSYLFGSILTIDRGDLIAVVVLGVLIAGAVLIGRRALFGLVVDEEWAAVAGLPVVALGRLLSVLAALVIVAAMQVVGLLLVAALMVVPMASAQLVARSFASTLVWSVGIGVSSVVGGLVAARAWGLAPGGTIVLAATAVFVVVAAGTRGRRAALLP